MKLFRSLALVAGLVAASSSAVQASTISVTGVDAARGSNLWLLADGTTTETWAGSILLSLDGVVNTPVLCVDLFTHISVNDTFDVNFVLPSYLDPTNPDRGLRAAFLFVTQFGTATDAVHAAGLQLAIWDIVHDGGDGFSAGRIQAATTVGQATDSAIRDAALQYIQVALNYQTGPTDATILRNVAGPYAKQQLITAWQPGTTEPTPEPATFGLMAGALGIIGGWRHYASKRAKSSDSNGEAKS